MDRDRDLEEMIIIDRLIDLLLHYLPSGWARQVVQLQARRRRIAGDVCR